MTAAALPRAISRSVTTIQFDITITEAALVELRRVHEAQTGRSRFEYGCVVLTAEARLAEFRDELQRAEVR